jgi:hypothetical protein
MIEPTICTALTALGFVGGYAANDDLGIILWIRDEPQPTEAELVAAGWVRQSDESVVPAPVEEAQTSTDAG